MGLISLRGHSSAWGPRQPFVQRLQARHAPGIALSFKVSPLELPLLLVIKSGCNNCTSAKAGPLQCPWSLHKLAAIVSRHFQTSWAYCRRLLGGTLEEERTIPVRPLSTITSPHENSSFSCKPIPCSPSLPLFSLAQVARLGAVQVQRQSQDVPFCDNSVKNSKYTVISFLPKSISSSSVAW